MADYAFTTQRPQLGRVQAAGADGGSATLAAAAVLPRTTLADIPGLVEGAHVNRGLVRLRVRAVAPRPPRPERRYGLLPQGHAFLRHVERCAALLLVVDLASGAEGRPGAPPAAQLRTLRAELAAYDASLAERATLVVGTKLDLPGAPRALAGRRRAATAAGLPRPRGVSAARGAGVEALRSAVLALADQTRAARV